MTVISRSLLASTLTVIGSWLLSASHTEAAPTVNLTARDGSVNVGFPYGQEKIRVCIEGAFLHLAAERS
jgi:hypothetical protein